MIVTNVIFTIITFHQIQSHEFSEINNIQNNALQIYFRWFEINTFLIIFVLD